MNKWILSLVAIVVTTSAFGRDSETNQDELCWCLVQMIQEADSADQSEYSACEEMLFHYLDSARVKTDSLSLEKEIELAYTKLTEECFGFDEALEEIDRTEKKNSRRIWIKIFGIGLIALMIPIITKIINRKLEKLNTRLQTAVETIVSRRDQLSDDGEPQLIDSYEAQSYEGIGQRIVKGSNPLKINLYSTHLEYTLKDCSVQLNFRHLEGAEFEAQRDGRYVDVFLSLLFEEDNIKVNSSDDETQKKLMDFLLRLRIRKSNAPLKGTHGTKFSEALVEVLEDIAKS